MSIKTTTHLNFWGEARAAFGFLRVRLGGQVVVATYGDFGMTEDAPGAHHIVFGQVQSEDGFRMMAYDIPRQT